MVKTNGLIFFISGFPSVRYFSSEYTLTISPIKNELVGNSTEAMTNYMLQFCIFYLVDDSHNVRFISVEKSQWIFQD